ncbi:Bceaf1 [Botrytis cinerea B05.10]|uniref:Vacuolar import and degradation protein 21 n=1 Tax=Botryotinia fuckeliana (strain B05.10) TaxID=332648 RepID=A0A384JH34_BOTFB|nr:Bceaf1 [Botrytis cinerea B05.10]ATZ49684.1 Bceaf1 [Botrytis cinerea B05.10]
MSEVGAPIRNRLLRSKQDEASRINSSRKRKLRELFAVCDNEGPIPVILGIDSNAPPTNSAEAQFLEACDILQDRPFNESNLPARRQLRSDSLKQKSAIRQTGKDLLVKDASHKIEHYFKSDGAIPRKSRGTPPIENSNEGRNIERNGDDVRATAAATGVSIRRSPSKSLQTNSPTESSADIISSVEEAPEIASHLTNAAQSQQQQHDLSSRNFEVDRIKTVVESPPGSPGVNPREAVPPSAEDVANLQEPVIFGANDENHHAATAHLPPKEVQEARIEEMEKAREHTGDRGRHSITNSLRIAVDLPSSPSSTIDAHSTTTPARHDVSADTSPENDNSRYEEAKNPDNDVDLKPSTEPKSNREDIAQEDEHNSRHKTQNELSSTEALGSNSMSADAQLRMEDQAAAGSKIAAVTEIADSEASSSQGAEDLKLLAQQDRNSEKKIAVERAGDGANASLADETVRSEKVRPTPKANEVPDSEGEGQTPVDAMDLDVASVKDSSESQTTLESGPITNAKEPTSVLEETPMQMPSDAKTPPSAMSTPTTRKASSSTPVPVQAPIERMTTRVASGAIRHKSVSEILGETPAPNTSPTSARSPVSKLDTESAVNSPSRGSTPGSTRSLLQKSKEKNQSRLSTVVFAKKPTPGPRVNDITLVPRGANSHAAHAASPYDDYFACLYLNSHNTQKTGYPPLDGLLQTAHKTITTSNAFVPITENQTTRILKRIYGLQNTSKWSLRQPKRSEEPIRPTTHWDVLLQEAKWMRTDFREERKWKMAVAKNLAYACAEWFEASVEERKILQVNATRPALVLAETSKDVEMDDETSKSLSHPTPELIASAEFDSPMDDVDDELRLSLIDTVSPTAIFGLQDDDVVFGLSRSPATDKLLEELPLYGAPLSVPCNDLPTSEVDPDRFWRRPAVGISKYVEGRMELKFQGPSRKRSRFEYEEDSEDEDAEIDESRREKSLLPPEQTNIGLFDPANKHIRDRIHAGHQFRPPSEFPMPVQSFFENRSCSQWTCSEDDELKRHVREYAYNWSLISNMLSSRSLFSSGAERRTPWECFERWIALEGLPAEMQKTAYFKAYNNRMEAAQRNLQIMAAEAARQPIVNGQPVPPRKRTTTTQRVEKRRNQKHLSLIDAMRRLAKKRENSAQKQQLTAAQAAARKPAEPTQTWTPIKTPQEFSRLKHDREEQYKKSMAAFQLRQEQVRREAQARQRNAIQQQQAHPNGLPQRGPALPNGLVPPIGQPNGNGHLAVPGQNRPRPLPPHMAGVGPMPNNLRIPQAMSNGVPQAQMQGGLPLNPALTPELADGARRAALQQRQQQHMQSMAQQQNSPHPGQAQNSPPRMNGMPAQPGFMPNNMNSYNSNHINGMAGSPGISAPSPAQAGSPRLDLPPSGLPNGGLPPNVPFSEIAQNQRGLVQPPSGIATSAMNAAAGNNNIGMNGQGGQRPPPIGIENASPQMYAQMLSNHHQQRLITQQAQQQAAQQQQQHSQAIVNQNRGQGNGNGAQQNGVK